METLTVPEWLLFPMRMFAGETERLIHVGIETLGKSKVAFVGLARDCGRALRSNLTNLKNFGSGCREWCLHIEENDSTDNATATSSPAAARFGWVSTALPASSGCVTAPPTPTSSSWWIGTSADGHSTA
ncbi:MAG: hypothetical protein EBS89_10710 [Proteobacteria bacterium]|nr:hypothetical protein [Pseudomonadota bacterium]